MSYGFLAPRVLFITLSLVGAVAALLCRRFGITVVLVSTLCLYVAATPAFSSILRINSRRKSRKTWISAVRKPSWCLERMYGAVTAGIPIGSDPHPSSGSS